MKKPPPRTKKTAIKKASGKKTAAKKASAKKTSNASSGRAGGKAAGVSLRNSKGADEVIVRKKSKSARGNRILRSRLPKDIEDARDALIIKGGKTPQTLQHLLKDFHSLRKPHSKYLSGRTSDFKPFDDHPTAERFCYTKNCPLMCVSCCNKKRESRLIFLRTYDWKILDMVEFYVSTISTMSDFPRPVKPPVLGSKPIVICQGPGFDVSEKLGRVGNLLCDFFGGIKAKSVLVRGIDRAIVLTALHSSDEASPVPEKQQDIELRGYTIVFRQYAVSLMKQPGAALPRVELQEMGPAFEVIPVRAELAGAELWKLATRIPPSLLPKKTKNISKSALGETTGRIHLGVQNLDAVYTPHAHGAAAMKVMKEKGSIQKIKLRLVAPRPKKKSKRMRASDHQQPEEEAEADAE